MILNTTDLDDEGLCSFVTEIAVRHSVISVDSYMTPERFTAIMRVPVLEHLLKMRTNISEEPSPIFSKSIIERDMRMTLYPSCKKMKTDGILSPKVHLMGRGEIRTMKVTLWKECILLSGIMK